MILDGYEAEIRAVKTRILTQGVPTKYAKGLAILSVLNCEYMGGDALAGVALDSAMQRDPGLLDELDVEAELKPGTDLSRHRICDLNKAYATRFQVFRALVSAWASMELLRDLERVE